MWDDSDEDFSSHSDIRHSRPHANITPANVVVGMKKMLSDEERKDSKIVHRTVRKLRDEAPDEVDDMSPIMKLRKQSRNKSDAYLIRHSQNLDEFLEVAERVEKEAIKQHVEYNKEVPDELIEIPSIFSTSKEDAPLRRAKVERVVPSSSTEHNKSVGNVQDHDQVATILDKMKQRVAVERAGEISLSKTIRNVRTVKLIQKTSTVKISTENPQSLPYRSKSSSSSTISTSCKSMPEQQSFNKSSIFTTQFSTTSASANRKVGMIEQTCGESKNIFTKSLMQSGKPSTKDVMIKRRSGIVLTSKAEIASSRNTKITSHRKPHPGTSDTSGNSLSSATFTKNATSIRMSKKSPTISTADTETPCTSNSSAENSPQHPHATTTTNAFLILASQEQNDDSQSLLDTTCRSTTVKSSIVSSKGALHSHENTAHPTAPSNHDLLSSRLGPAVSRPKSAPQKTSAVTGATSLARTTPPRSSPPTLRRPVRGATRPGPQVSSSITVTVLNPHNRTMKRTDSCSTASRPLLIKTGTSSRPRWK